MKYNIAFDVTNHYSEIHYDFCLIGGFFKKTQLSPIMNKINTTSNKYITSILNKYGYTGKIGETLLLHHIPNTPFQKILIVGCGTQKELNKENYKKIIHQSIKSLRNTNTKQIISFLTELNVNDCNNYWKIRYAVEIIQDISYFFTQFKNHEHQKYQIENVIFYITNSTDFKENQKAVTDATIISRNINVAKDLGNMPPNFCNSEYLIQQTQKLTTMSDQTTIQIIDENQMATLGMNAYLSVAAGRSTNNPPLISIIKYLGNQNKEEKPLILIGKGITFDSGGLCIKPSEKMDEMKYDMCGAAAVYAILRNAIQLNLPINVIGILATCDNMITNSSMRPGDIVKTLSGQTVEIKNTDAEGRLILCDTLTYATRFNPEIIIDIATLTGACVTALGNHFTGLMSNCDLLAHDLIVASDETDDKIWRLPLHNEFQKQIQSNIADITNVGGGTGGAITAACFLEKFINKHRWAHLDIAGTAWTSNEKQSQATGRPVAMMTQFLINYEKNQKKIININTTKKNKNT